MPVERTIGSGVTQVSERSYLVGSAEFREWRAASSQPGWWRSHFPSREWLEDQLSRIDRSTIALAKPHEDAAWFVEAMLRNLGLLEASIANGDAILAAVHAAELATLATESNFKVKWEGHALAGQRSREGGKLGPAAKAVSLKISDDHAALFAAYDALTHIVDPIQRRRKAAAQCERVTDTRRGYSDDQARRILKKR